MKQLMPVLLAAALLSACGLPDSPQDAERKALLAGAWSYEFRDVHERPVTGTLTLTKAGIFSGTEQREGESVEDSSGEWFVTDGLLKIKTMRSNGQRLGSWQMLFFTCKLTRLEATVFECLDEPAQRSYRFRRSPTAKP